MERWEYDNLGEGRYRVRLIDGETIAEKEFELDPKVRWPELKARLAKEVVALTREATGEGPQALVDVDYTLEDLGAGRHRVTLLDGRDSVEFEMPLDFTDDDLQRRIAKEVKARNEDS
jgi:hypothetical protein